MKFPNVCFLVFGVQSIIMGAILIWIYPVLYDVIFNAMLVVVPGSYSYDLWHELTIPMTMAIYFFNVTNSEDITARLGCQGNTTEELEATCVKPILVEVGPYVFQEKHLKVEEKWSEDDGNSRIAFKQEKYWYFDEDLSGPNLTLDDEITNINMVALAAAEYSRYREAFYAYSLDSLLVQEGAQFCHRSRP